MYIYIYIHILEILEIQGRPGGGYPLAQGAPLQDSGEILARFQ